MKPGEALLKYFGHKNFRQNQEEIIDAILNGENAVAVLPTGAGKSICYQVPALISDNFSIVISPLIALMKDQVDSLNSTDDLSAFINSTMEFYEAENVLQNIGYGKTKILYVAPERLENLTFADRIKSLNPNYLFIDEAHCISEWGHNFRPSYRKIKEFAEYVGIKKISAFTATATPEVVDDIIEQLGIKKARKFVRGFERENLFISALVTKKKKEKCFDLIRQFKTPAIIYTSSRKKTEEVSEFLNMNRINCAYYHAGLAPEERKKIQEDFLIDKTPVIAATNAFGMGIDKKDIRLVIHYNTPGSIENFYQEIGRAGRDGKNSYTFLLHEESDINIQKFFITNANPDKELIQNIYNGICDYAKVAVGNKPVNEIPINMEYLTAYCKKKISRGQLHSTLRILESGGYLKSLSEYNSRSSITINFDKERLKTFTKKSTSEGLKEVLLFLVREFGSEIFTGKINFVLSQLADKAGMRDIDFDEKLVTLDNLGIITYNKLLAKENVILTAPRADVKRLVLDYKKINENYLHLQSKIDSMIDLVYTDDCRFKYILSYFGEDVKNYKCGKCDRCTVNEKLPDATSDYLKEIIFQTIDEGGASLSEKKLVDILTGKEKSAKYSKLSSFGSCVNYSSNDLKLVIHSLISQGHIKKNTGDGKSLNLKEELEKEIKKRKSEIPEKISADYEKNLEMFNHLRETRSRIAKRFLQSGMLICPDEVLREVAIQRPVTDRELLNIKGFTQRMFNKAGKEFLETIQTFSEKPGNKIPETKGKVPKNIKETLSLLKKGYTLKDIASLRKLSEAVISMQVETIIEYQPDTDVRHLFEKEHFAIITNEIKKGFSDLKDLKKRLPDEIGYPMIRIAVAMDKFNRPYSS